MILTHPSESLQNAERGVVKYLVSRRTRWLAKPIRANPSSAARVWNVTRYQSERSVPDRRPAVGSFGSTRVVLPKSIATPGPPSRLGSFRKIAGRTEEQTDRHFRDFRVLGWPGSGTPAPGLRAGVLHGAGVPVPCHPKSRSTHQEVITNLFHPSRRGFPVSLRGSSTRPFLTIVAGRP